MTQGAIRTSSVPPGDFSVSGASYKMHNNINTGYINFQGAGGFGLDVRSSDGAAMMANAEMLDATQPLGESSLQRIHVGPILTTKSGGRTKGGIKKLLGSAIDR